MTPAPSRTVKQARKPASSSTKKARGSRAHRAVELAAARQKDEAAAWMSTSRVALDRGAVGYVGGWQHLVESIADWSSGRSCSCSLEHQRDEPCPSIEKQRGRALARQQRVAPILAKLCHGCENPPHHVMVEDDLRRARPGAEHPSWDCSGCAFAFVGILDEQDKSMAAVMQPRPELERLLRRRLAPWRREHGRG